jgi:pyrroloquinoline quinone (PQQ) biosynthesis protein C
MIPKVFLKKKNPKVCYKNMIQKRKKKKEKDDCHVRVQKCKQTKHALFVWLISHQYFSLRTNQPSQTSQQYFSLRTNQHQPSATSRTNRLAGDDCHVLLFV